MKGVKIIIRIWIALASLGAFAASWIALAHAPKPDQFKASSIQAMPKLPPVPSINQFQSFQDDGGPNIVVRQPMVRLRTSGS
ncbi:MAG: hypothetical protein ACM3QS_00020 [Bacteroidota bacterium]